jgi:hypothetical protein
MFDWRQLLRRFTNRLGYSIHRKATIHHLLHDSDDKRQYSELTESVFGVVVPIPGVQLATNFAHESPLGSRFYDAMINVELEWVKDLFRSVRDDKVEGAVVEFGVFEGNWMNALFDVTEACGMTDRPLIGFDSFRGLSTPHPELDDPFWKEGMYAISRSDAEERLQVAKRPRIKLIEGYFADSLVADEAAEILAIAYARIDCDIYEPALQCLRYLSNRLSHGSILVFDDWPHRATIGEGRAFFEWVPTVQHLRFEFLGFGPWGHFYIRVWHLRP